MAGPSLSSILGGLTGDARIMAEAKFRFRQCEDWEAIARSRMDEDERFANGNSDNNYQWDGQILIARQGKPCLTMNKVRVHNNIIVNDAKQNKPGVNIRPTGDEATYEAAQVYQNIIRNIEYKSSAENIYDKATEHQVYRGIGYWTVATQYEDENTFNQEIVLRQVNNPNSVYLDPDIKTTDGSDARFGFEFRDWAQDELEAEHPDYPDLPEIPVLDGTGQPFLWVKENHIRVAKYHRKTQKTDKLVAFTDFATGEQVQAKWSELNAEGKEAFKADPEAQKRDIVNEQVEWFLIAGDKIIDRGLWVGKYIPIVRVIGIETVIDGELDRCGHTRWLKDPQRQYNYFNSNSAEFLTNQTKSPWIAPAEAIENRENQWNLANIQNQSVLTYNAYTEDGRELPPPVKVAPPMASPGYVQQLQMSENQMMMVSGQYQAQMGENENAKSGVAIDARQRQGDRATYHFIDNLAIAIRFTGKIFIDLIPKIYDTERMLRLQGIDGKKTNVRIDPNAPQAVQKVPMEPGFSQGDQDTDTAIQEIIFNPNIGKYDVQSDVGPSYATKRQQAFAAMTDLAKADKNFMGVAGDLYFKAADFPEADMLAQRFAKMIPPNIRGDAPDPKVEEALNAASQKVQELMGVVEDLTKKLADKDSELDIRQYEADTKRLTAIGNSGPAITPDQVKPIFMQLLEEMTAENPPEGARLAPDGEWYLEDESRPGKYVRLSKGAMNGNPDNGLGAAIEQFNNGGMDANAGRA